MIFSERVLRDTSNMFNLTSPSHNAFQSNNVKTSVSKYGRRTTQFDFKSPANKENSTSSKQTSTTGAKNKVTKNENVKTKLRCRKRIDYQQMYRGSSLANEMQPVVVVQRLQHEDTDKKQPIYSKNSDSHDDIRPSQVYEFDFDAKCESELQKQFKKEATVLKKVIKAKYKSRKINTKQKNLKKTQIQISVNPNPKNKITQVNVSDSNDKNKRPATTTVIVSNHKIPQVNVSDSNDKSLPPASTTVIASNHKITQVNVSDINDKNLTPASNRQASMGKSTNETFDMKSFLCNQFKRPQSTPIQKSAPQTDVTNDAEVCNDSYDPHHCEISQDVSKICDDFEEILQPTVPDVMNQSVPWRAEIHRTSKEKFFLIKNSSLPSYNQEIIIKSQNNTTKPNNLGQSAKSPEKKTRQSSILSYMDSSKTMHNSGAALDGNCTRKSHSSCESSLSDISVGDKLNPPINDENYMVKKKFRNRRVNFQEAITSSPSMRRKVLGENNSRELFEFDSFEFEEKRNSKKPARFTFGHLKNVIKPKDKIKPTIEPIVEKENEVIEEIDLPPPENNEENANTLDTSCHLFDEPRFSDSVRRSYGSTKAKRKRVHSVDSGNEDQDTDEYTKPRKKKRNKKEDVEFKKWAKQFNSMCKEVDKEELVIE